MKREDIVNFILISANYICLSFYLHYINFNGKKEIEDCDYNLKICDNHRCI